MAFLVFETLRHGLDHGSIRIVVFHSPYIGAAETARNPRVDIEHLEERSFWVVIGVEGFQCRVIERYGNPSCIEPGTVSIGGEIFERGVGCSACGEQQVASGLRSTRVRTEACSIGQRNRRRAGGVL